MNTIAAEQIKTYISELRKQDIKNFNTNYFLNDLNEQIQYLKNDTSVLFLQPDRDIFRLYFAYTNINDFEKLLGLLPNNIKISLEILTKKEIDKNLYECINKYLQFDTVFERYRCKCKDLKIFQKIEKNKITYAKIKDIKEIGHLLNSTFNYYSSHLPSTEELEYLINNKTVIIEKNNNDKINTVIIFKKKGKNINFDQLINTDNQPLKMMHALDSLYSIIKEDEYNEIFLWVDTIYNKDVIKLHKLYKYKSDLLKDYYFINSSLKNTKI